MKTRTDQELQLRVSEANKELIIPVNNSDKLTLQFAKKHNNSWSTAVIAIRGSIDGEMTFEFPTTLTATGETTLYLDVSGINYVHLVVTTAESSTSDVRVNCMLSRPYN